MGEVQMIGTRYSAIVDGLNNHTYHILGCGAIGSAAATQIVRMGGTQLKLYDIQKILAYQCTDIKI